MNSYRLVIAFIATSLFQLTAVNSTAAQGFDISGMWAAIVLEDWNDRLPGPVLGEYFGIPINDAARQKAESWDASILSQPERQVTTTPGPILFSWSVP